MVEQVGCSLQNVEVAVGYRVKKTRDIKAIVFHNVNLFRIYRMLLKDANDGFARMPSKNVALRVIGKNLCICRVPV